jgi:arginine repressor
MVKSNKSSIYTEKKLLSEQIQHLRNKRLSQRQIVTQLYNQGIKTSRSTVQRILAKLAAPTSRASRNVWKTTPKLTDSTARHLVRLIRFHDFRDVSSLVKELRSQGYVVSKSTVYRKLKSLQTLRIVRPRPCPYLTAEHRFKRLQWAKEIANKNIDWSKVFFADEKVWMIEGPAQRAKQWYDRRDDWPSVPRKGYRCKAVRVWGAFSVACAPPLVQVSANFNSTDYCKAINSTLLPHAPLVLYHDRLPSHHSAMTNAWLKDHAVHAELLPPKSPDLNPIENLWAILSKRVFRGTVTYDSVDAVYAAIEREWTCIQNDVALRTRLVDTMPIRLHQVIERNGKCCDF